MALTSGNTYTVNATIRNTSQRGGEPIPVIFRVVYVARYGDLALGASDTQLDIPADGEQKISWVLVIPTGLSGDAYAEVNLYDPDGLLVVTKRVALTIVVPTAPCSGQVYDMVSVVGISGVQVVIGGDITYTDNDGNYSIPAVLIGDQEASFTKAGYETTRYLGNYPVNENGSVIDVGLVPLATASASLTGIVTMAGVSSPLSGVTVSITGYQDDGSGGTVQLYHETVTDAQGLYSFDPILNITWNVIFNKSGYLSQSLGVNFVAAEHQVLDIELVSTAGVANFVLNYYGSMGGLLWDCQVIDDYNGQLIPGIPSGIKEFNVPMFFNLTDKSFYIYFSEFSIPSTLSSYIYLVEIPVFGEYTWNVSQQTLSGPSGNATLTRVLTLPDIWPSEIPEPLPGGPPYTLSISHDVSGNEPGMWDEQNGTVTVTAVVTEPDTVPEPDPDPLPDPLPEDTGEGEEK